MNFKEVIPDRNDVITEFNNETPIILARGLLSGFGSSIGTSTLRVEPVDEREHSLGELDGDSYYSFTGVRADSPREWQSAIVKGKSYDTLPRAFSLPYHGRIVVRAEPVNIEEHYALMANFGPIIEVLREAVA